MSKLTRFLKLERARPEAEDPAQPSTSGRFARLEPRHEDPPEAPADPFMPPPEREVPLEVAYEAAPAADKARAERRARAESDLAKARDEAQPELAMQSIDPIDPIVRATNTNRWFVLSGGTAAIAIGGVIVSPIVWGLLPILIAVVIGSAYAARDS